MRMRTSKELTLLLERYRLGKCTDNELSLLRLWMDQLDLRVDGGELSANILQGMQDKMYVHIMERRSDRSGKLRRMRPWYRAAACCLVLTGISVWLLVRLSVRHEQGAVGEKAVAYQRIENSGGHVKEIRMPDGTRVWLNGYSVLYVDSLYNAYNRNVKLEGEAFFEVAKQRERPFVVVAGGLATRVLGTSFNVEAYDAESESRVSLLEGSVRVNDSLHGIVLHPGEMIRFTRSGDSMQVFPLEKKNIQAWIRGELVFNETPLADALHRIELYYGIHIVYDRRLAFGKRVTLVCGRQEKWPSLLKTMLFVHGLDYAQHSDTIYIHK